MGTFVVKRLNMIAMIIFCSLLLGLVYGWMKTPSRSTPRKVVSSANWASSAATVADQMAEADLVVRVKVLDVNTRKFETTSPRYTEDGEIDGQMTTMMPFTDSTMQVLEVYKGEAEKQITVMQTGGALAAIDGKEPFEMVIDENPIFVSGDEHMLFLKDISGDPIHAKGRKLYRPVNPAGRYLIQGTRVFSPYEFSESVTPPKRVDELLGQIKQASTLSQ